MPQTALDQARLPVSIEATLGGLGLWRTGEASIQHRRSTGSGRIEREEF